MADLVITTSVKEILESIRDESPDSNFRLRMSRAIRAAPEGDMTFTLHQPEPEITTNAVVLGSDDLQWNATDRAIERAGELGVDLDLVTTGSGTDGRITVADIEAATGL
jgi:pyruvate/2-oxoglutarate dehydrogenase complex dihydrolipoamide acyltransferase (E2) component